MNGFKYLTCTAVCVVAVLFAFIIVLEQFNLMVFPTRITAFSLKNNDKGSYQLEFLGEKAQLPMADLEQLSNWGTQNLETLTQNVNHALKSGGRTATQVWDAWFRDLPLEEKFEQFMNIFETGVQLPSKELLPAGSSGVRN